MPDAPSDARGSSARRRWIALIFLAIVVGTAFAVRWSLDGWVRQTLERVVAEKLAGQLHFGQFRLDLWRLQVSFSDLQLQIPRGSDGYLRITVAAGHARLKASSLLGLPAGQARLTELRLQQPRLEWVGGAVGAGETRREFRPRPIDLRIEHLEILDGRGLYVEPAPPWSFEASEVALTAAWSDAARALVGRASFRVSVRRQPFVRPLELSVRSGFELRRHDVALADLEFEGPGLGGTLSVNVRVSAPLAVEGQGRVEVDLEALQALLDPQLPPLAGRLAGPVNLDWGAGQLRLRGQLRAQGPRFGMLAADSARAIYRYADGTLEVLELEAQAYGGSLSGTLQTSFGDTPEFQANIRGRGVDAATMLASFGAPLPLSSRVDFDLSLGGQPMRRSDWVGHGSFTARQAPGAHGGIPVQGQGELQCSGGLLQMKSQLDLASSELQVEIGLGLDGTREGRIAIEGTTVRARDMQLAAWRIAEALGVSFPDVARRRLDGSGSFSASFELGEDRSLRVVLDLSDGRWGRRTFDRAALALEAADGNVSIRKLDWVRGAERVAGSASFRADPFSVRELELSTESLDVGWVLAAAGLDIDVSGRLDASLRVAYREGAGRYGSGRLRLVDGRVFGEPYEEILGDLEVEPDAVRIPSLELTGPGTDGLASLHWAPRDGRWEIALERARVRLGSLEAIRSQQLPLDGEVELSGSMQIGPDTMDGELQLSGKEWRYEGRLLGNPHGTVTLAGNRLKARLFEQSGWNALLDLQLDGDGRFSAQIALEEKVIDFVEDDPASGWARITGRATISGALGRPETLSVQGAVDQLTLQRAGEWLETAEPLKVSLEQGDLNVSAMRLIGPDTDLELNLRYEINEDRLQASASGHLDLGVLSGSWPDLIVSGQVGLQLEAHGPLAAPVLGGSMWTENGRVRWPGVPQALDQLAFRLRLDGQQAELQSLRGRLGNGEVRATGVISFDGFAVESYEVAADLANIRLLTPEGFRGDLEAQVIVTGTAADATIGGEVTLLRGVYDKDFDLERFRRGASRQYSTADPSALPSNVFLDLKLTADGNLWVRNDLAEVESSFDLHLGGSLSRPEVTGRVAMLEGGTLEFRDVEYELRSGSLDFVELERINPYLTFRADTQVREYTIYLRIEGTLEEFEYELTSEPSLSTQDIIAVLTTGSTLEEITGTGGDTGAGGDVAANYFSGALSAVFEKRLERLLGLEKVRIDPLLTAGESDPTTRLTIGEEVLDDVFVVFSTDLTDSENQLYEIDWRVTRRLRLGARRDTSGGVGGEVRYTDRFWWNKPPTPSRPTTPAESRTPFTVPDEQQRVASVQIVVADGGDSGPLVRLVPLEPGQRFSRSAVFRGVEAIKRHYVQGGRIETRVDATVRTTEAGPAIVYSVVPSPPVALEFHGTTRKEERLLRPILETLWIESIFSEELYDDAVERIRKFFHARGHYAADVHCETESTEGRRRVRFEVEPGEPVRVERVTLHGVQQLSEARVRAQMLTRPTTLVHRQPLTPAVLEDDLAAIRSLYRDEGYLEVRVGQPRILLSSSAESAEIELQIEEGRRCTVSEVRFPPDLPFGEDEMRDWAGVQPGQVFSPAALLKAESRLRAGIDAKGYPDVRVRSRVQLEEALAQVSFEVQPGGLKRVGAVSIRGNRLTRDKVIRRELELATGDVISRADLLRTQHQLYRLGIFRNVTLSYEPMDPDDPTVQRLEVRLEESAPLSTSIGVGYDTEADARVSFSLTNENLAGYDRVLSVQGKHSGLEQRLQLVAREPRLFNRRLDGLGSVGWEVLSEAGFTEEIWTAAFRAEKHLNARWDAYARYGFQLVELSEVEISPEELEEEKLVDGRLADLGIGLVRDTRDNPFLPTRGTLVSFGARLFARPLASEFTFVKGRFAASFVKQLGGGSSVASGVRVGLAFPYGSDDAVPISEAFFAGGDSTIRGFARDEVGPASGGEALLVLNEEFRFPIWHVLKGVVFYDTGNVYAEAADFDFTDLRHVLGIGLRLETAIGPLRLEYGRKLDREPGESTGEFFVSIGSAF